MKRLVLLAAAILLTPIFVSHAQVAASIDDIVSEFSFTLSPEVPGPNQTVDITLENYSVDLVTSVITWTVNGARLSSGRGLTHIQVSTKGLGSETRVTADIDTGSQTFEKSVTLEPAEVDLLWQGNTYTPPFYKGRTLWGAETSATVLAIPHVVASSGAELNPKNLYYKWSMDGTVQGDKSGVGRNTFSVLDNALLLPKRVRVDIMTDSSTVVAEKDITLSPEHPTLLVYEDNPLYGIIFGNAVGNTIALKDKEVSFTAMPMLMGVVDRNSSGLSYTWSVSGSNTAQKGSRVTYRAPEGGGGKSQVSVKIEDKNTLLESADKDFLVQFGSNGL